MKTRFTSAEITHVWAHKSSPYGQSPGSMSFNSDGFYSYSTQIARHVTHKGKSAVVFNETSYSVTTSRQQGKVLCAIPSYLPVFRIGGLTTGDVLRDIGGKELFNYAVERAAFFASKIEKARNKDQYRAEQSKWLEAAAKVNEFFNLHRKVDEKTIERLKVATQRAEAARAKAAAKRELADKLAQEAGYAAWIRGDEAAEYFNPRLFPTAFRVEGDELVSTLGARVPLHDARVAYRFARSHKNWHRNGETCPVGGYQLDAINEQGIVAGCHRITWAEMDRLAPILA